ncbi:MAG: DUF3048 domain-containing protein [Patescibacteria group bacterium]
MNKSVTAIKTWLTKVQQTVWTELKKKDNLMIISAVFAAVIVMLVVVAAFLLKPAKYDIDSPGGSDSPVVVDATLRHPLTGEFLDSALEDLPQVYSVMVENSADAWPLSGVDQAFLVIEVPVEGNIPRFITFFSADSIADKIGPVRSARPYYLDWAQEFSAIYTHVGGSPEALDILASRDLEDLNEFYQGEYFWRDVPRRLAPHNVYTSIEKLLKAALELKPAEPDYLGWLFKNDAPIGAEGLSLVINWGEGSLYDVSWEYDLASNSYTRLQGSDIVRTEAGELVTANNIVVLASDITVVDSVGRRHIRTLGEGDALVVQDGNLILGTWKKETINDRLRFYTSEGEEIRFNAGKTWIEVVPSLDRASTVTDLP